MDDPAGVNLQTWARRALDWAANGGGLTPDAARLEHFILRVGRAIPLVLACGADLGPLCRELDRLGASAFGVDPSPEAVALARARYPTGDLREGDLRALPWPKSSFDGAVVGGAISRLSRADARVALVEIHRVLRMGALLSLDLITGEGQGFVQTTHGPLFECRWNAHEFVADCETLDLQLLESTPLREGVSGLLFRREY
jgi:SAM-dependent methyltransferase